MGAPKITAPTPPPPPPAAEPPAPPPPPTKVAEKVKTRVSQKTPNKRRGVSALTVRRPSVNIGGGGTGAKV